MITTVIYIYWSLSSQVWPNISIIITTVLKMTKSSTIIYIHIDHCCLKDDQQWLLMSWKWSKVVLSYIHISITVVSRMTNKYIYNDYYWCEDDQKVALLYIYIYIYHCCLRWDQKYISIAITTIMKAVLSYINVSGPTNKYI